MTEKTFIVKDPVQLRMGGWLCQVLSGDDKTTILYETYQSSRMWAFQAAVMWIHDLTDGKATRVNGNSQQTPVIDNSKEQNAG